MTAKDIISRDTLKRLTTDLARHLLGTDERRFREYMTMLEILSENRDLEAEVAEAQRMLTQIDIKRLPSYTLGFEDGEATGEARGKAQSEAQIVLRLLTRLDTADVDDLLGLPPEEVARIAAADQLPPGDAA